MSSTALYKALTEAGASEGSATAAADGVITHLQRIEINIAELKITNRVILSLVFAMFLVVLKPFIW